MAGVVRDATGMIAGMNPVLDPQTYVYCCIAEGFAPDLGSVWLRALASFREDEGLTLVLTLEDARELNLPCDMPMRRITLTVPSALDGVGLTAAVATALAGQGIACNMMAALHHDHVFVPEGDAVAAMAALRRCQEKIT